MLNNPVKHCVTPCTYLLFLVPSSYPWRYFCLLEITVLAGPLILWPPAMLFGFFLFKVLILLKCLFFPLCVLIPLGILCYPGLMIWVWGKRNDLKLQPVLPFRGSGFGVCVGGWGRCSLRTEEPLVLQSRLGIPCPFPLLCLWWPPLSLEKPQWLSHSLLFSLMPSSDHF